MLSFCQFLPLLLGLLPGMLLLGDSKVQPCACAAPSHLLLLDHGDEDMKVLSSLGKKPSTQNSLEPSEEEIHNYFLHKSCGNLERARQLGEELGSAILSFEPDELMVLDERQTALARMLYLFVAENCVQQSVQDPILLKLILAQMNDTISVCLPHFYSFQYRCYTMYKICLEEQQDASAEQQAIQLGRCWARIVGHEKDEELCFTGCKLYLLMKQRCERLVARTDFLPIR